jgi:outer membrane protein assembly factor BamA
MNSFTTFFKFVFIIWILLSSKAISNTINKIEIIGNDRISDETIKLFISINK